MPWYEVNTGKYFFKNTHLNDNKLLKELVNVKWKWYRNCLNIFTPIIGNLKNYI